MRVPIRTLVILGVTALVVATFLVDPVLAIGEVVVVVVAAVALVIHTYRHERRFMAASCEAAAALARGDLDRAGAIYAAWAQGWPDRVPTMARHGLAWTLMRVGDLEDAIAVLLTNERTEAALKDVGLFTATAVNLALDYALVGDIPSAAKWLDETEQRSSELSPPFMPAMKAFARAVIDCRTNRCAEAARTLDDNWGTYEATLTGETLRPLQIVRAFATAAAGPRNAGLARVIRPAYPGEFDFLGVAWPEMATFLATQALRGPTSATGQLAANTG